jgi:tetratricopeptide (TPR) repeat protein
MRRVFTFIGLFILLPGAAPIFSAETPPEQETRLRALLTEFSPADTSTEIDDTRLQLAELLVFTLERDISEAVTLLEPQLAHALAAPSINPVLVERLQTCLGTAYSYVGRVEEAIRLLNASCASAAQRLGADASATLKLRGNRASFYGLHGDAALAETELRNIAVIYHRRDPDSDDALHARTQWMISLGRLGRWPEAEAEIRDILARRGRLLGPDHPDLTQQLNLLCWVLYSTDRSADAIPVMEQIVAIRTRELGPHASRTLTVRYNLAAVYARSARYDDAEHILQTDLAVIQTQGGETVHEAADYLYKLGELALYRNQPATAVAELSRTETLYLQPKAQGWRDSEQRDLEKTRLLLARACLAHGDIAAARRATEDWLGQLEEQFNLHLAYTSEVDRLAFLANESPFDLPGTLGDPELLARASLRLKGLVLDSLLEDQRLARASSDPAIQSVLRDYQSALTTYTKNQTAAALPLESSQLERLERELVRLAVPVAIQRTALTASPAVLLAQLPPDAVLVDYLRYRHDRESLKQEERYLALVGSRAGWRVVPLGPAAIIDEVIGRYHILVNRGGPIAWAQEVRRLVLDPVRDALPEGTRQLFVSPDGLLQSVVFATLPENDPAYIAADRHAFANITSARDLRPTADSAAQGPPLVLAAPVWSGPLADLPPLPYSATEGAAIAAQFGEATLLTGSNASPVALIRHLAPRVLHIATHTVSNPTPSLTLAERLRRTGLALAGDPGLLNTLQISALDLRGTALVFLSGCETGEGEIAHGEGVLGLQRGFARAGARALVLTLWPVADQDSRDLTTLFYAAYSSSGDPIVALQEARAIFRKKLAAQGIDPAAILRRAGAHTISVRR